MKTIVATVAALLCAAGVAGAQDDRERKMDELKREFERSMKGLQQKFDSERERMQKEFKAAQEKLFGKKDEEKKPRGVEDMLRLVLERLDALEKRLDHEVPKFRGLEKLIPEERFKNFDFKRFGDGMPDEWRKWMEQMPKFKGAEDFKFEFRKAEPKKEEKKDEEKPGKKKKEKENDQD